jgi:hypothetical protein
MFAYIYVGRKSKVNFEIGAAAGIWGWRQESLNPVADAGIAALRAGKCSDLLFVTGARTLAEGTGWPRTQPYDLEPWRQMVVEKLWLAKVCEGLYVSEVPVWPDAQYPYRVGMRLEKAWDFVTGKDFAPGVIGAIRGSALGRGMPALGPAPFYD